MADIVIIAKVGTAAAADIQRVSETVRAINPEAMKVRAASPITLDVPEAVRGRRVLVVEDGPTTTHGGMPYGAGYVAATRAQAGVIIDPRPFAAPATTALYAAYPQLGPVLPAAGYSPAQVAALQQTLNAADADIGVAATPMDLTTLMTLNKPVVRARYEFTEVDSGVLAEQIGRFLQRMGLRT